MRIFQISFFLLIFSFLTACTLWQQEDIYDGLRAGQIANDKTPPVVKILYPTNNHIASSNYLIGGTVYDEASGVKAVYISINSGSPITITNIDGSNWSTTISLAYLPYATYSNFVYAVDISDNTSATDMVYIIKE